MKKEYQIADRQNSRALAQFLSREGQALLPMLELIEQAEMAVDELIDVAGRATVEAVLTLSAQELAGPKHPGKRVGVIGWHGRQDGVVSLAERKVRISKPRLRRKGRSKSAEVEIPAYAAMRTQSRIGGRMLDILMRGVSTRNYAQVLPEMAETVGVSKSQVNRLGLPGALRRCLCTTNVIESPNSGIRRRTGRVSRWKGGSMLLRWVASALIETEKSFRRIMGCEPLWMLKSYLDNPAESEGVAQERKAG